MTYRAPTWSCARPRVFRGLLSSCLPLLAARSVVVPALVTGGALRRASAPFGQDLETQSTGDRGRFYEFYPDGIAEPVRLAGPRAHHGVTFFVMTEIFIANSARRHE